MAMLDEQLVEEWLNRQNFFTIRGIKTGVDEIDLLAVKNSDSGSEYWHVEVQVSFRPIGYIGGDTNARKRTDDEIVAGVEQWISKKYTSDRKKQRRNLVQPNADWRYVFVHGNVKDQKELELIAAHGVQLIPYKQILTDLCSGANSQSSSAASNIVELLKFMQ